MDKIILGLTRQMANNHSSDFANYITQLTHSRYKEIIVEEPGFTPVVSGGRGKSINDKKAGAGMLKPPLPKDSAPLDETYGVNDDQATICDELEDVITMIKDESRYADLLIIDPAISFNTKIEDIPTHFVRDVIRTVECPVLVAPEIFNGVEDIVFCYDGTASAVFAIKQFTYLFEEYSDKNAIVLHVNGAEHIDADEVNLKLNEWLKPHYASVNFHSISGNNQNSLKSYFLNKERIIVVMGAYGRSVLSYLLKESHADSLIKGVDLPLFITHH